MENYKALLSNPLVAAAIVGSVIFIKDLGVFQNSADAVRESMVIMEKCDQKYASKETVQDLKQDVTIIKQDVKELLKRAN